METPYKVHRRLLEAFTSSLITTRLPLEIKFLA